MAHQHFDIVSNTACTNRQGFYLGKVYYANRSGQLFAPYEVDLGRRLPDDLEPANVVKWAHARMVELRNGDARMTIAEKQIVALGIQRLCYSRKHEGAPDSPYLSGRLERVASLLIAKNGALPFDVKVAVGMHIPENGIAALRHTQAGLTPVSNTVMLPVLSSYAEPHPTTSAVELHASHQTRIHGGINDLTEVASYSDIWSE